MFSNDMTDEGIDIAVRQIKRWIYASEQDRDPYVGYLHATYAVGDIDLLRELVSDMKIFNRTRIDILDLRTKAIRLQDSFQKYIKTPLI
jgi:hypothetical protein